MTADRSPRRPPGRYDEQRPLPQAARVSGYLVLGALLVGLAWFAYDRFAADRVHAATLGYDVRSDTLVVIRFEVRKEPADTVRCRLQARDRLGAVVGDRLVDVGPASGALVRASREVTTTARAATGEVTRCEAAPGPPAPTSP